jgi:hypothetical protein
MKVLRPEKRDFDVHCRELTTRVRDVDDIFLDFIIVFYGVMIFWFFVK